MGIAKDLEIQQWEQGWSFSLGTHICHRCLNDPELVQHVKENAVEYEKLRQELDSTLSAIDPGTVTHIHKMQEFVVGRDYPFRAAYWVATAVGLIAMLLTIAGIYGVLSYLVTQRRKEIGIRIALGATTTAITRMVLKQSARLAALGILFGVVVAMGASRFFASRLEMMNTFDAGAYGAGVTVVLAACLAAAYYPSRRAAQIDPMTTLAQFTRERSARSVSRASISRTRLSSASNRAIN